MSQIKILYIDSQKDYASNLLANLINEYYDIRFSDNIKDAFVYFSQKKPDIIICDSKIQGLNSFDFLKKLKYKDNHLKFIILTNESTKQVFLDAIELKIDKLLFKNQTFTEINNQLKKIDFPKNENKNESKNININLGNEFYYTQNEIIYKNKNIVLTVQENSLIKELIKSKGNYVDTSFLQKIISKKENTSIDTLRTVVRKIRKKTYSDIINNKSGVGYKINFIAENEKLTTFQIKKSHKLNLKILLIKGEKKDNNLLTFQLEKLGFSCEYAYTITNANILLEHEDYDYIISDLYLPDGESINLIKNKKNARFIILSNDQDIHYKEYLYFKGVIDCIKDRVNFVYLAQDIYTSILKIESNKKFNNILLIDQSKQICQQIKKLLEPRNYNITILHNLETAQKILSSKNFSLIIIDMNLDNNFQFLHSVKSKIDKTISFLMLTDSEITYDMTINAYKNGLDEPIKKPLFAEKFLLKIEQVLKHTRLMHEFKNEKKFIHAYKTIIDQSAIISIANPKGIITYVNQSFCNTSGYTKDELLGQNHSIVRDLNTPDELFRDLWKTISIDKKVWTGILSNKNKNNEKFVVQTSIMPILDSKNNITEFIALRNDITNKYKDRI